VKPAPAPTPGPVPTASPGNGATEAERRVDATYRQHLEQQRSEIEKLQQTLAKTVTDAITQNREFGALLQIELRALQQANGDKEVEQLRQILVGGLEELIQGQNSLEAKLHKTGGYLRLIKADSERLHEELNKVRLLSLTDEFTGLPNRRAFMRRLQDEISRSQRYGASLALAIIDLDEFKAINDIHGHATGDAILRCYATDVLTVLRHHDLVARYGGEEFAILMPNTTREGAVAAIEKARSRALQVVCEFQGRDFKLPTFSTGIALYVVGESHTDLIDRADRALYRAKRLGRNRIELEQGLPAATPPRGKNSGGG
jgi:diguanylate cyclase (GGDEF)-like protein